jgi:hypothetical protein
MFMVDVAVALLLKFGDVAMAFTVVLAATGNQPTYLADAVVGWLPSNV